MDKVRLGVIGCGNMSKVHMATALGASEDTSEELRPYASAVQLHGLADVTEEKAEAARAEFGGEYVTDDPERIFTDPDIDAVLITTWHDTHAPFSLRAMEAGKHVLIEKPMAMTEAECDQILEAEERTGVKYMVAFRCRFAMGTRDVKREIPSPDNVITFARVPGIWGPQIWAQDPIKGGGQILSQGCHVVDLMMYLAGSEPESVYATGGVKHHESPEVIDTVNASVRFANGAVGSFMGGDGGAGRLLLPGAYVSCPFFVMAVDKGRSGIAIDHGQNARFESAVPADVWTPPYEIADYAEEFGNNKSSGMGDILPSFGRSIIEDETPIATAVDGARATRFILKCFESVRTGEIVKF